MRKIPIMSLMSPEKHCFEKTLPNAADLVREMSLNAGIFTIPAAVSWRKASNCSYFYQMSEREKEGVATCS